MYELPFAESSKKEIYGERYCIIAKPSYYQNFDNDVSSCHIDNCLVCHWHRCKRLVKFNNTKTRRFSFANAIFLTTSNLLYFIGYKAGETCSWGPDCASLKCEYGRCVGRFKKHFIQFYMITK